ncbi:MAG TPA: hypothetical protein PL110_08480 [Candidatus Eremiobacteraeota bacterium]|nr:MAG: hypothetical protein BWY64_00302 [bacterium ADurb.Bin363]HPZ08136.1 hypothetical protein [Candidatus Eremiobacteraeota bacterium]
MELKDIEKRNQLIGNITVMVIMIIISVPYLTQKTPYSLIDYVNLAFHEAGHFVLALQGSEFIHILGGTLGQLFVPCVFSIYFFKKKDYRAFFFTIFWFFENFINISIYMADAPYQQLPLLGGDGVVHDWVYLCGELKCLRNIEAMAMMVRVTGTLGMIASIMGLGLFSFYKKSPI